MDRAQKQEMVAELGQIFAESGSVVVSHYSGLSVAEMTDLRRQMKAAGARFKVAKNRLAKIALENHELTSASDLFTGPTGIAYGEDPVAAAKVLTDFSKKNDKLVILGGLIGDSPIDAEGVKALASMPSIEEMRSKLLGVLSAPGTKLAGQLNAPGESLARVLAAPGRDLAGVLQAYRQKQEAA